MNNNDLIYQLMMKWYKLMCINIRLTLFGGGGIRSDLYEIYTYCYKGFCVPYCNLLVELI